MKIMKICVLSLLLGANSEEITCANSDGSTYTIDCPEFPDHASEFNLCAWTDLFGCRTILTEQAKSQDLKLNSDKRKPQAIEDLDSRARPDTESSKSNKEKPHRIGFRRSSRDAQNGYVKMEHSTQSRTPRSENVENMKRSSRFAPDSSRSSKRENDDPRRQKEESFQRLDSSEQVSYKAREQRPVPEFASRRRLQRFEFDRRNSSRDAPNFHEKIERPERSRFDPDPRRLLRETDNVPQNLQRSSLEHRGNKQDLSEQKEESFRRFPSKEHIPQRPTEDRIAPKFTPDERPQGFGFNERRVSRREDTQRGQSSRIKEPFRHSGDRIGQKIDSTERRSSRSTSEPETSFTNVDNLSRNEGFQSREDLRRGFSGGRRSEITSERISRNENKVSEHKENHERSFAGDPRASQGHDLSRFVENQGR